jgi:hypothetical protein
MESEHIVLGKNNNNKVCLNNGKYGHYLSCDGKNYKVPEWFPVDNLILILQNDLLNTKRKCMKCIVMNHQIKQ